MEARDAEANDAGTLSATLLSLAPAGVAVGCRPISVADIELLHPAEEVHIRQAVQRRRAEFASGRALLRDVIGTDVPIPAGADRSPILPRGVRASLAHDDRFAIVAVTTDPTVTAVGIDIEAKTPLPPDVAALVLRADEQGLDPHAAFTMKEAAYKAWSTLGGRMLEHHEVHLTVRPGHFQARIVPTGDSVSGRWATAAGRWLALVTVRSPLTGVEVDRHSA